MLCKYRPLTQLCGGGPRSITNRGKVQIQKVEMLNPRRVKKSSTNSLEPHATSEPSLLQCWEKLKAVHADVFRFDDIW